MLQKEMIVDVLQCGLRVEGTILAVTGAKTHFLPPSTHGNCFYYALPVVYPDFFEGVSVSQTVGTHSFCAPKEGWVKNYHRMCSR